MKNTKKHNLLISSICEKCGNEYIMKYASFMDRKYTNVPYYCPECMREYRIAKRKSAMDSKSDEEKERIKNKVKNYWKNLSDEDKKKWSEMKRQQFYNMSEEDQKKAVERFGSFSDRWKNMNREEKEKHIRRMMNGKKKWLDNLTDEEKEAYRIKNSIRGKLWWNSLSEEERLGILQPMFDGAKKYWENLSDEDKVKRMQELHELNMEYWNNLSDEEMQIHRDRAIKQWLDMDPDEKEKRRQITIEYWKNMSRDDFENFMLKVYTTKKDTEEPNSLENKFINYLDLSSIVYEFQYRSTITHPDFYDKFSLNAITFGTHVSSHHVWDFQIKTKQKNILVDIDGGIHDPNRTDSIVTDRQGKKFSLKQYIEFNDSQRPYQTDGLDAYIIRAYNDDNINDDTEVVSVTNDAKMSFKEFMRYLISINN